MYKDTLEWVLDILENDKFDIREVIGEIRMALKFMETTKYDFEKRQIMSTLIGEKEEEDAE